MSFATATGLDGRIFLFVLLSTFLTALSFSITPLLYNHSAEVGFWTLLDALPLMLTGAIFVAPFFLPTALLGWVLARILFWKVGFGPYVSAVAAGFISGLSSVIGPSLYYYPTDFSSGAFFIGTLAALSGGLAAGIIYWDGWKRLASWD